MVSCSSLSYYLSDTVVLKDISFTVDKNELVVLCGANGAGNGHPAYGYGNGTHGDIRSCRPAHPPAELRTDETGRTGRPDCHEAPLLLLDEPFANLDPAASRQLVHHLRHLNGHHGYTIIVVTHDMNLAARLARRIIILDNGRMVADDDARSILTDALLLRRSRLETPILTRMFQRILTDPIHCNKIPLTIDEAILFLQNHSICRSPASAIDTPFIQSDDLFTDSNREDI